MTADDDPGFLRAAARERERIGLDLHDGLGQELTAAAYLCASLEHRLTSAGRPEAQEAARLAELLNSATQRMQSLVRGLAGRPDGRRGLPGAIEGLAGQTRELHGLAVEVLCTARPEYFDGYRGHQLYFIAREALYNVVRHAEARTATIELCVDAGRVTMTIADDGCGLPSTVVPGLGLRAMRYRARLLHGTLTLQNGTAGGTRLCCECPLALPMAVSA